MKLMFTDVDPRFYDIETVYEEIEKLLKWINKKTDSTFSATFPGELMNIKPCTREIIIHDMDYGEKTGYMEYEVAKVYFREGATIEEVKRKVRREISKAFLKNDIDR